MTMSLAAAPPRAASAEFVGVMGSGLIGVDPFAENAWSGSSRYFFGELQRQARLRRAFGVEVAKPWRLPLMLRNFSLDRNLWRNKFYLDTGYYHQLSRAIAERLEPEDRRHIVLQIGGIYDLRPLLGPATTIYSYHDGNLAQAMRAPQFPAAQLQRPVARALAYEKKVYDRVDRILTMSEYLRRSFIEDFGQDPRKVHTIGAGINIDAIPPFRTDKDYGAKRVLFIGADFDRKGGQHLLQAFRKVRSRHRTAELHLVGPRQLSIDPSLAEGVVYHGFLSKRDPADSAKLQKILQEATLYAMPSLYEPFGIAPLEAMAHQVPAVLSDAWAFPEMITPGENGELVRPGNVEELAEKLDLLLSNPALLQSMGTAGRKRVEARFTWPAVVQRLLQVAGETSR